MINEKGIQNILDKALPSLNLAAMQAIANN